MKTAKSKTLLFTFISVLFLSCIAYADQFIAFSLNKAEMEMRESGRSHKNRLFELGGITRPVGIVYDANRSDLIVVGQINEKEQKISLDDFVVALRAISVYKESPLVSIDRSDETETTKRQRVRFEGGIENTKFGKDLLEADIILKKMGVGELRTDIWGVKSYVDMSAEYWNKTGIEDSVSSRFWFKPSKEKSFVGVRDGVVIVKKLVIDVKTEVMGAINSHRPVDDRAGSYDEIGDRFASAVAANIDDIDSYYSEVKRLDPLFRLVGLAEGIKREAFNFKPDINFWLNEYRVEHIETLKDYPLLVKEKRLEKNGENRQMTINGGIELRPLLVDLNAGVVTALRDIVIKSRPEGNPLIWKLPLEGWQLPEDSKIDITAFGKKLRDSTAGVNGMSLTKRISPVDSPGNQKINYKSSPLSDGGSNFNFTDRFSPQKYSPHVGGVMLQGVAKVSGGEQAKVDLTSGNFSLIVGGQNARLAPEAYRKFITALWSVYYSQKDPGISIDPIGCFYFDPYDPERDKKFAECLKRYEKKEEKHMVRYIGKVINTDLGRVMREADYVMKKWSVGTEKPGISGFKSPDEYRGWKTTDSEGSSRFWFVPEDMKFKRGGDMLLFEDGRMTVKTEYMFKNDEGAQADPYNEKFAGFFTEHYGEIANKYPVYQELFEYAKMVSLAKYLKEQGLPMFWFLMANKDLVITEDSPGTVEALAKGSDYYKNLYIMGGVDLGFDARREGNYVYDREAVRAINEAVSKLPLNAYSKTTLSAGDITPASSEPFSFNLGKDSFTVVPQHSLTSGKDRHGIRYQTDIALRGTGLQLTGRALETIKNKIIRWMMVQELNPILRTKDTTKLSEAEIEALNKRITEETEKAKTKAGKIIEKMESLKNIKYTDENKFVKALEETIGREKTDIFKRMVMEFAYYNTNLDLVRYFKPGQQDIGEFGKGWHLLIPYRLKPAGDAKRKFLNVLIPEKMAVENQLTGDQEVLTFSTDRYTVAGYVPAKLESSQVVGLFMMSDASYRLADKLGNEFWFDRAGYLTDMIFSEDHHIHVEYADSFTDAFEEIPYQIQPAGKEQTAFLNVFIPRKMTVKNLISGDSEILTFSEEGEFAGYVPENAEKSSYKILALMSDASFHLLDKNGNETSFSSLRTFDGKFKEMAFSSDRRMVRSVSQGNQKIGFKYSIDRSGEVMIASANLSEGEETKLSYIVKYKYDKEGRLYSVTGTGNTIAKTQHQNNEMLMHVKK